MSILALDILRISVEGLYLGAKFVNVFFYQAVDTGEQMPDVLLQFELDIMPAIQGLAHPSVYFARAIGQNLFDLGEKAERVLDFNGAASGGAEALPGELASGFRLLHDELGVREGAKRFVGVGEGQMVNGEDTSPIYQGDVDAVLLALADTFTTVGGVVSEFIPVVVGRILVSEGVYRLPESLSEALAQGVGIVATALWRGFTTQVSRKVLPAIS